LTVALDITLTPDLIAEGYAREFINRIQNLRKESGLELTDRIHVLVSEHPEWNQALIKFNSYICTETLAMSLTGSNAIENGNDLEINDIPCKIRLTKVV
jgi:isoleucyl-tRNA synthetase